MKTIKFDQDWFTAQFGKRPGRSLFVISEDINNTRRKLCHLEKELLDVELFLAKEDAALKSFVNTVFQMREKK